MQKYHFCCLDVVNSIEFECQDGEVLNYYVGNYVNKYFSDDVVFKNKRNSIRCDGTTDQDFLQLKGYLIKQNKKSLAFKLGKDFIHAERTYNNDVFDLLGRANSIEKVINTMGVDRIKREAPNGPVQTKGGVGFPEFIGRLIDLCQKKSIHFQYE